MLFDEFSSYMRLSPFFSTSYTLIVKSLLPPAFGIARRRLQVCLKIRSDGELMFRLVCFPQTWPTISRDGEEAGLSLAGSLQFHWEWLSVAGTYSPQQPPSSSQLPNTEVLPYLHSPWPLLSLPTWSSHF